MIPDAQYIDGKIAIRYNQPVPRYVRIGTREYVCDVRYGVSMLFVTEEEVAPLLAFEEGCNCGGGKRKPFSLASPLAVNVWKDGNY